jgi:hypothetical protein
LAPSIDKTGVVFGGQCNEIGVVHSTDAASVTPSTLSFFIVSSLKPPDKDSSPPRIPNQWYQGVRSIFNRAARCRRPLRAAGVLHRRFSVGSVAVERPAVDPNCENGTFRRQSISEALAAAM